MSGAGARRADVSNAEAYAVARSFHCGETYPRTKGSPAHEWGIEVRTASRASEVDMLLIILILLILGFGYGGYRVGPGWGYYGGGGISLVLTIVLILLLLRVI
jgi:hypothetical protein